MNELFSLVQYIGSLPGIGEKIAERIVLSLLERSDFNKLLELLTIVRKNATSCSVCGCVDVTNPCSICNNTERNNSTICVVANMLSLWAIEKANCYEGKYHVLVPQANAVTGILPEHIKIEYLIQRIKDNGVKEVVVALTPDINGQTAMFFIQDKLKNLNVNISTLSCGVPIGGELDRLSYGTLVVAFNQRKLLQNGTFSTFEK